MFKISLFPRKEQRLADVAKIRYEAVSMCETLTFGGFGEVGDSQRTCSVCLHYMIDSNQGFPTFL